MVWVSEPVIIAGIRVARVTVCPLQYNPQRKTLTLYRRFEVTLNYHTGGTVNILEQEPSSISRTNYRLLSSKVVNFSTLDLDVEEEKGSILIIAPVNTTVLNLTQELVEWKKRKGFNTVLVDLSQTGNTASQIITYLQEAYNTWEPPLAYLILIGDCAGSIAVPPSNEYGDHDYTRLDGDDILADIAVGRFSCANTTQLMTEIAKVITYESDPYIGEVEWYKKGAVVAGSAGAGLSTIQTKRGIRYKALLNDYTQVDTMWYNMGGSVSTFTTNQINAGIGFYNYRGMIGMSGFGNSNISGLTNYFKLPFVVTITCETGDITTAESAIIEEFFRAGSVYSQTGAIGAIGTATGLTHTRHNNCIDNGIFGAFFDYGIFGFGDALNSAKLDLFINYPDNPTSVENFSHINNLIGDPSCQLWTDIPQNMEVNYPDTLPVGSTSITITLWDSLTSIPLHNADVCLYGDGIQILESTDENGEAFFPLPFSVDSSVSLTCCLHNYKPHLGRVVMEEAEVFVNWSDFGVDDDNSGGSNGNGDSLVNPGEIIELGIALKNFGAATTATEISATLQYEGELAAIIDSVQSYPDLEPGMASDIVYGFSISIGQNCADESILSFQLNVVSQEGVWDSYFELEVYAADIVYQSHAVIDPDSILNPGEQKELEVTLLNDGRLGAQNLQAVLYCDEGLINIVQDISAIGNLGPEQSAAGTPFIVEADPYITPGLPVHFDLYISGDDGFADTCGFDLIVGIAGTSDPLGADEYGYYALDDTDTSYYSHPIYDWIEIDPNVPGHQFAGIDLGLSDFGEEQDDTRLVNLPFIFTYYGEDFSQAAICSNGWLAFGADMAYYTNFRNWCIPSTLGPYALLAVFWDDLYLVSNPPLKVYHYFDESQHRYIVEWDVLNWGLGNPAEIFQAILLDPQYYPTQGGDGMIIFQYLDIANIFGSYYDNHFATVGIKSPDNLTGLQYTYWNHYPEQAAVLDSGRAIKFSTDVPVKTALMVIDDLTISISGDNVILDWGDIPQAENYNVYRSNEPYFRIAGMVPIASISNSYFEDDDILNAETYFYVVTWE